MVIRFHSLKFIFSKEQKTPREGTPGFRPPEVLLKYPHQTTGIIDLHIPV